MCSLDQPYLVNSSAMPHFCITRVAKLALQLGSALICFSTCFSSSPLFMCKLYLAVCMKQKNQISLFSRYYVEARYGWRDPSPRLLENSETSQRWRAVNDPVSDLTDQRSNPRPRAPTAMFLITTPSDRPALCLTNLTKGRYAKSVNITTQK